MSYGQAGFEADDLNEHAAVSLGGVCGGGRGDGRRGGQRGLADVFWKAKIENLRSFIAS